MITDRQVREAAFWEETICPNCGETEGEPYYACIECNVCVVLPAKQVLFIRENIEAEEEEE